MIGLNEQTLIEKLRSKDEDSFAHFVELYKKKVLALCISYTLDYQEAEDLSQEAFLSFYRHMERFRGESTLSTYLYKITLSKCLDYKRKKNLKNFLTGLWNTQKESMEDLDEKTFVRQCINSLSPDLKNCILLYYYLDLSQKEIGSILNLTPKTVEGRIYRAKAKLREKLEKEGTLCKENGIL